MKIIFLDVDGPLIPLRMHVQHENTGIFMYDHEGEYYKWDKAAVEGFNRICEETGAFIVFNSTHNDSGEGLWNTCKANGLLIYFIHPFRKTGFPSLIGQRTDAIYTWLSECARSTDVGLMPPVKKWVAVDDADLPGISPKNHVKPTLQFGMTPELFDELRDKLNDES